MRFPVSLLQRNLHPKGQSTMRVIVDVAHPHHAHFYGAIANELVADGAQVRILARNKDVTLPILRDHPCFWRSVSEKGRKGRLADIREGLSRTFNIWWELRSWQPNVLLSSNPTGILAAMLAGVPSIFDTMDGPEHGLHYEIPARLCSAITASEMLGLPQQPRLITYPGLISMAHVPASEPSPSLRQELGLSESSSLAVLRLSDHSASHDHGREGLSGGLLLSIFEWLERRFDSVLVSAEGADQLSTSPWIQENPERFIELLHIADIVVGDSVTVASEAAVAGTPSVWISEFVGSRPISAQLEARYGVTRNIALQEEDITFSAFVRGAELLLSEGGMKRFREGWTELMLHADVARRYADLVKCFVRSRG